VSLILSWVFVENDVPDLVGLVLVSLLLSWVFGCSLQRMSFFELGWFWCH
jgi:hypothetical protein